MFGLGTPDPLLVVIAFVISVIMSLYQHYSSEKSSTKKPLKPSKANKDLSFEKLGEHTSEFNNPEMLTLLNGKIHVAIGKIIYKVFTKKMFWEILTLLVGGSIHDVLTYKIFIR